MTLIVSQNIMIAEDEISEEFIRASGPGGQNVNKVATAVKLKFDAARSRSLPSEVKQRLFFLYKNRINLDGFLIIDARNRRTREANRLEARERLAEIIRLAAIKPKLRRKTKPTHASRARRLDEKKKQGRTKSLRKKVGDTGEE
ncbi:aminoacyl-tRNA hydrolase [candidate division TA06 bacterium]|uniref:Aminoacyl-tRNA hydrolase n=1 Tax=candidate division TA06 bacterium TaxID=2250710 RepID=A0A933ICC7_UNCT6|nr:aminoacyl-tRNA hydrolase [candidate division TA06 bacterium]